MTKLGERFYRQQAAQLDISSENIPTVLNGTPVPLMPRGQQWNLYNNDPQMTKIIDDTFYNTLGEVESYINPMPTDSATPHHIEQPTNNNMIRGHFMPDYGVVTRLTIEAIDPEEVPDSARERLLIAEQDQEVKWPSRAFGGVVLRGEGLFTPFLTERYPEKLISFVTLTGLCYGKERRLRTNTTLLDYEEAVFVPSMRFDWNSRPAPADRETSEQGRQAQQNRTDPGRTIVRTLSKRTGVEGSETADKGPSSDQELGKAALKAVGETTIAERASGGDKKAVGAKKAPGKKAAAKKTSGKKITKGKKD